MRGDQGQKRRELLKTCLEKYKMSNSEARAAVQKQLNLESYGERTFYTDLSIIRQGYKDAIKLLVQEGTFEYFWGTVNSIREQIKKLNLEAESADSTMSRTAVRNSIVQAELILLNLVSRQNIEALEKLRLETRQIIDVPAGDPENPEMARSLDEHSAEDREETG